MSEEQAPVKRPRGRPRGKRVQAPPTPPESKVIKIKPSDVQEAIIDTDVDFNPSPEQMRFAQLILTRETAWKYSEIATEINTSPETVSKWFNDVRFRVWLETVRHRLFMLYKPPIDQVLMTKAMEGSFKHMELYYALTGDLTRIEMEKSESVRNIDSMGVSEQFRVFKQRASMLMGRMGEPAPVDEKNIPPRIDVTPSAEDDDE